MYLLCYLFIFRYTCMSVAIPYKYSCTNKEKYRVGIHKMSYYYIYVRHGPHYKTIPKISN